jgi:hypothetical protein
MVLQPVSGKALPVHRGEVLRVTQTEGGQCVDFNAYNLHDYKEYMSIGASRVHGFHLSEGATLFTNPPRLRPMLHIAHMPASCVADTLAARCHSILFERQLGFRFHTNCQDTYAEAIREYDLTPDDVHDSFNMFMNTAWDAKGAWWIGWNTSQKGDCVDLVACMDSLCVPIVCGSGDAQLTSNFFFKPIQITVFESTEETAQLADQIEEKYAAESRKSVEDFKVKMIRKDRELRPNHDYLPEYPSFPMKVERLAIPLSAAILEGVEDLVRQGFATDLADAIRRAFMVWFLKNHARDSRQDIMSNVFVGALTD